MDNIDFRALLHFHHHSQNTFADVSDVSQGFVSQIARGERPIPARLEFEFERLLAVGTPQSKDERLLYVVGRAYATGDIVVPDDPHGIPVFRSSEIAAEIARHLRKNGYPNAIVVPIWENGIWQLVKTNPDPKVTKVDDEIFRDHIRRFTTTKRTWQKQQP